MNPATFTPLPQPLPRHYPAVYWFWHRVPAAAEIREQLAAIQQAGYRTFLIQPRLAFPRTEYLGAGYLQAYRTALETAAQMGLTAGLYDDYNWISGHAGGRTVAGHDELRERQLFWSHAVVQDGRAECAVTGIHNRLGDGLGPAFQNWVYEGSRPIWGDWQVVRAYACPQGAEPLELTGRCRIVEAGRDGCRVQVDAGAGNIPPGTRVIVFAGARCLNSRLVNMLHPRAAARFIQAGYEPYRQTVGDFFGKTLDFLFIDQPYTGFYVWDQHFGGPLNALMYDDSLEEIFYNERGYDLGQALLSLVLPEDAESPRLRCDFFETYGRLARERFLAPLAEWAHEQGLKFAGHELLGFVGGWGFADGLQGIDARVNFGADYFAIDAYKDISSVDACNYHAQLSARFGGSLASAHGRRGCMVEQYSVPAGRSLPAPAGQWDLTLAEVRSQALRHTLFGADTFLFHAFYQTNDIGLAPTPLESPRFDFPPGINYEPWFRFHARFAHELACLNLFLQDVQPQARSAVLYPLRACWHDGPGGSFNAESAFWNRRLTDEGAEYDIIDETMLEAETLLAKGYRLLILPGVSVIPDGRFCTELEKYVEKGGMLIASGALPGASQKTGRDETIRRRFADLLRGPRAVCYEDHRAAGQDGGLSARLAAVQDGITVLPAADGAGLPILRRGISPRGPAAALFNDSSQACDLLLRVPLPGSGMVLPERWFPGAGARQPWLYCQRFEGYLCLPLRLQPYELACFIFHPVSDADRPRLSGVEGEAQVESAALESDGSLRASLLCAQAGALRIRVHSAQAPRVWPEEVHRQIQPVGPGEWLLEAEVPRLPDSVKLEHGWHLRLPGNYREKPVTLQHGWQTEAPAYAGAGYYRVDFELPKDAPGYAWQLVCPSVHTAMSARLNQDWTGVCAWPPYELLFSENAVKPAYNHLQIAVWNTAGNAFYTDTPFQGNGPAPSGLDGIPELYPYFWINLTAK